LTILGKKSLSLFNSSNAKLIISWNSSRLLDTLRSLALKKKPDSSFDSRVLVFALYKKETARVEQMLRQQGYTACALHGDMSQSARMEMLERFKSGQANLMVATDVAARGLDIPNVGTVINYSFPLTIEDYIHRIGRTGKCLASCSNTKTEAVHRTGWQEWQINNVLYWRQS